MRSSVSSGELPGNQPDSGNQGWIDTSLYPFRHHYLEIDTHRIHYVDEGKGPVVLFAHGTPEWSFGYRELIKLLRGSFRCVAPDYLGFGLSDKPEKADYSTPKHAERFEMFIEKLGLKNISIIANDFGGSIALNYAIRHPENIHRICLSNTWLWSLSNDRHYSIPGRVMSTGLGRLLYRRFNLPVTVIMPRAYGNKSKLTRKIHFHYKKPLSTPAERNGTYGFAKDLMDAGPWWDKLWMDLDRVKDKKFLIFWGLKDSFVPARELDKWVSRIPDARVITFEQAGHFVQEEEPEHMARELREFLS